MSELLKDPFLYLNYAAAGLAIYLLIKFGRRLSDVDRALATPGQYFFEFATLAISVGVLLWLTIKFGDISLMKLGIKL